MERVGRHGTTEGNWKDFGLVGFIEMSEKVKCEKASHETSLDLDSCFDHQLGLISRP